MGTAAKTFWFDPANRFGTGVSYRRGPRASPPTVSSPIRLTDKYLVSGPYLARTFPWCLPSPARDTASFEPGTNTFLDERNDHGLQDR